MKCAMIPSGSGYKVITPYNREFVQRLKEDIPASGRAYDPNNRYWLVSAQYSDDVVRMIANIFGIWLTPKPITAKPMLGIIELLYLGSTKDRGNGEKTASGWTDNGWTVVFPEKVLKAYFDPSYTEQSAQKPNVTTYYETLCVKPNASADEIKSGYRRMVKQWHPDVCHDPDATEVFRAVQHAFEILSNPRSKARYDVGLKLSATTSQKPKKFPWEEREEQMPYRAPLKCGNLLCEYTTFGVKKIISKILQWEDIYNDLGQTLVSSWKMGDDAPTIEWR